MIWTWVQVVCYALTFALLVYGFIISGKAHRLINKANRMLDKLKGASK